MTDPETFKTRFHLDLLSRLMLFSVWKMLTAQGLTSAQCQHVLTQRLEGDRLHMDEYVASMFPDPAVAAVYAEQASQVIDQMETSFAKLVETMKKHEPEP
jgi:hypothetical protein